MPLIFVHGVNTRDGEEYRRDRATRDSLFSDIVLAPLAKKSERFRDIAIANPYWGGDGVSFAYDQATRPDVRILEHLGPVETATPKSDAEYASTVKTLATGDRPSQPPGLERLGASDDEVKRAAASDPEAFVEAVLLPLINSEMSLLGRDGQSAEDAGRAEARILNAALEVATDPQVRQALERSRSGGESIDLLAKEIQARVAPETPRPGPGGTTLERLGPRNGIQALGRWIGEIFDRAKDAPQRAATLPALAIFRDDVHANLSRFMGDVFVYLSYRDGRDGEPGAIPNVVLDSFMASKTQGRESEPMIAVTHSMGANIVYDLVTHYARDLKIDYWITVATQVGLFEEMKLFKSSDKGIRAPKRLDKPDAVKHWVNFYDPADVLSFKVAPVWKDTRDLEFLTGASALRAHGAYFKRPSFYVELRKGLEDALP